MPDADLTIITLSRNRDYFQRLGRALEMGPGPTIRMILVNNSSNPDLTEDALRRGWLTMDMGRNTGFSEGCNLAARAAQGDWLLLLNDDVVPEPEFLDRLWAHREEADILGALLLDNDGRVNHAGGWLQKDGSTGHIGRLDGREYWEEDAAPRVPWITFAVALIRRSLWDQLRGLDEGYWYGCEDSDFCLRALQAGATIRCARDAVAVHNECGTRPRGAPGENGQRWFRLWRDAIPGIVAQLSEEALAEGRR